MVHARPDYNRFQDPLGIIPKDEPVFLLRAQDATAPAVLRYWAEQAGLAGAKPEMVAVVLEHAKAMEAWQSRRGSKVPDMADADVAQAADAERKQAEERETVRRTCVLVVATMSFSKQDHAQLTKDGMAGAAATAFDAAERFVAEAHARGFSPEAIMDMAGTVLS